MPNSEPSTLINLLLQVPGFGYIWFLVLAVWGGTASYISRIRKHKLTFSLIELIGEWAISGFAGVITALVCYSFHWDFVLVAAASGIAGHMGGRAIGMLEYWLANKIPSRS